jgi:hypothetical protein
MRRSYRRKKRYAAKRSYKRRRGSAYSGYQTGGSGIIQKKIVGMY